RGSGEAAGTSGRGEWDDRSAHGTAGRSDHDRLPWAQSCLTHESDVGGPGRVQHRGRLGGVDAIGQTVQPIGRCGDEFGERALTTVVAEAVGPHPIARAELLGRLADGDDRTHEITTDDEREGQRCGKGAGADEEVDVVDLAGLHPHEDLRRARLGNGQVADSDVLDPAGGIDEGGAHVLWTVHPLTSVPAYSRHCPSYSPPSYGQVIDHAGQLPR